MNRSNSTGLILMQLTLLICGLSTIAVVATPGAATAVTPSIKDVEVEHYFTSHHHPHNDNEPEPQATSSITTRPRQNTNTNTNTTNRELQLDSLGSGIYTIGEPSLRYQGLSMYLDYKLSSELSLNQIQIIPYNDSPDCLIAIDDYEVNDYMVPELILTPNENDPSFQNLRVLFTIDPVKIQFTELWKQVGVDQFFISMCVGLWLYTDDYTTPNSNAVAIASVDTLVYVQVDLMGDFGLELPVDASGPTEELAEAAYFVEGYICNPNDDNKPFTFMEPKEQGSTIRVCVVPTNEALLDGVYMRTINYFTFVRDEGLPDGVETITQPAVVDQKSANDALTQLVCVRGTELCYFDTLLKADFFFSPGRLFGYGEAWLQFGRESSRRQRNLSHRSLVKFGINTSPTTTPNQYQQYQYQRPRQLQQATGDDDDDDDGRVEGGFAGSSTYDLNFFVIPPKNQYVYEAEAYHCDSQNREILTDKRGSIEQKTIFTNSIRICVRPDAIARSFGITISSIDSWNFTRDELNNLNQPAILPKGVEATDGNTILMCIAGSPTCAFRTRLYTDFYNKRGIVKGIGNVWLQYPAFDGDGSRGSSSFGRRRLQAPVKWSQRRRKTQEEDPRFNQQKEKPLTFAGESQVILDTPVGYRDPIIPEHCLYDHEVHSWWLQEDINDRYMYIALTAATFAALCCLLGICAVCPLGRNRKRKEETTIITEEHEETNNDNGGGQQNIKVNVGVKSNEISDKRTLTTSDNTRNITMGNGESSSSTHTHQSSTEDEELAERKKKNATPSKNDVCFDQPDHSGTKKFHKCVSRVVKKNNKDAKYTPDIYNTILEDLGGEGTIKFYSTSSSKKNGKSVEASKKERIELIGKAFKEEQKRQKNGDNDDNDEDDSDIETGNQKKQRRGEKKDDDKEDRRGGANRRRKSSRRGLKDEDDDDDSRRQIGRSGSNRSLKSNLTDDDDDKESRRHPRRSSSKRSLKDSLDDDDNKDDNNKRRMKRSGSKSKLRDEHDDDGRMKRSSSHRSLRNNLDGDEDDRDGGRRTKRSSSKKSLKKELDDRDDDRRRVKRSSSKGSLKDNLVDGEDNKDREKRRMKRSSSNKSLKDNLSDEDGDLRKSSKHHRSRRDRDSGEGKSSGRRSQSSSNRSLRDGLEEEERLSKKYSKSRSRSRDSHDGDEDDERRVRRSSSKRSLKDSLSEDKERESSKKESRRSRRRSKERLDDDDDSSSEDKDRKSSKKESRRSRHRSKDRGGGEDDGDKRRKRRSSRSSERSLV